MLTNTKSPKSFRDISMFLSTDNRPYVNRREFESRWLVKICHIICRCHTGGKTVHFCTLSEIISTPAAFTVSVLSGSYNPGCNKVTNFISRSTRGILGNKNLSWKRKEKSIWEKWAPKMYLNTSSQKKICMGHHRTSHLSRVWRNK